MMPGALFRPRPAAATTVRHSAPGLRFKPLPALTRSPLTRAPLVLPVLVLSLVLSLLAAAARPKAPTRRPAGLAAEAELSAAEAAEAELAGEDRLEGLARGIPADRLAPRVSPTSAATTPTLAPGRRLRDDPRRARAPPRA